MGILLGILPDNHTVLVDRAVKQLVHLLEGPALGLNKQPDHDSQDPYVPTGVDGIIPPGNALNGQWRGVEIQETEGVADGLGGYYALGSL